MDKEEALKAFINNEIKFLKPEDKFSFGCNVCGSCCRNRDDILLTPFDVYNIAKAKNIASEEVIDKYCNVYLGSDSKMPVIQVKFKQGYDSTICPFLKRQGEFTKCDVHERKPFICAMFPLGRATTKNEKTGEYVSGIYFNGACDKCDSKQEHTLKEWIEMFNLELGIKTGEEYHKSLFEVLTSYDLKKFYDGDKNVTEKTKQMMFSGTIAILYSGLEKETDETILDSLKERFDKLSKLYDDLFGIGTRLGFNFIKK